MITTPHAFPGAPNPLASRWVRMCLALALLLCTGVAGAAPLDNAAQAKVAEAINDEYLAGNMTRAEGLLLGTIEACGDRCSAEVLAQAWMYVGLVRGAGSQDAEGAQTAFEEALTLDAYVKLDEDLADDLVKRAFENAGGELNQTGARGTGPKYDKAALAGSGDMSCVPSVGEVERNRAIPLTCHAEKPGTRAALYFQGYGGRGWSQVSMRRSSSEWLGEIPCSATAILGELKWFAVVLGNGDQPLAYMGSEDAPITIEVVASTDEPAPAFGDGPPPEKCSAAASECPEDMHGSPLCPGTPSAGGRSSSSSAGWGASCETALDCAEGLHCLAGSCESAPSCENDGDCDSGSCNDGICEVADSPGNVKAPSVLFSVSVAADLSVLSGEEVCNPEARNNYRCYLGDERYATPLRGLQGDPNVYDPEDSGSFGSSLVPGTIRVIAGLEYVVADTLGLEARLGMAIAGRSPAVDIASSLHAGARAKYWFSGTGAGFRPFIAIGGGLGEVSARKTVATREWYESDNDLRNVVGARGIGPDPTAEGPPETNGNLLPGTPESQTVLSGYDTVCGDLDEAAIQASNGGAPVECEIDPVNAWIRLGPYYAGGSLGLLYNGGALSLTGELQAKVTIPRSALVLQPTLGMVLAF